MPPIVTRNRDNAFIFMRTGYDMRFAFQQHENPEKAFGRGYGNRIFGGHMKAPNHKPTPDFKSFVVGFVYG
jgi:hypothetical protein